MKPTEEKLLAKWHKWLIDGLENWRTSDWVPVIFIMFIATVKKLFFKVMIRLADRYFYWSTNVGKDVYQERSFNLLWVSVHLTWIVQKTVVVQRHVGAAKNTGSQLTQEAKSWKIKGSSCHGALAQSVECLQKPQS